MDKDTRNRIQHATQAARKLLEGEFAAQLEGSFDIRPDGTVAVEPGRHLAEDTDALRVRAKLVEAVAHHRALGEKPADAVKSVLRASAFTTLNRFVALKMLEARKIVQECVTKGLESSGFKNEFLGLADGLKVQPDAAYKLYLECLFDEIGREVRVLFDRRDPASLLWPRRTALEELLGIVNDPELAAVWGEDETIGWVYQYFNGEDERRQMRAESQAPRNSRELAVRNQFFTPRYVVEFLTDNTLGRTWVEMQRGETRLMEQCRYLVRRPSEVFLRQGEVAPPEDEGVPVEQRTVYVPFRAKKDPREIRVLDPACGSGHFLLYSFDLLLAIYEEAWADPEFAGLRRDFATVEALRLALPGLILRYNLHGVDIDPRAAQIAAMALWMRAQRAWNDFGVRRADRPLVTRTNVVVAEPMPGERDLLEEFCRSLVPEVAGLVRQVFEDMQLAGEAGTLLRIEETVREELRKRFGRGGLFAKQDAEQWADVEHQVYEALRGYAEQVPGGAGYRRRLFAEDAARGFAFIDVSRKRYDVVLMNPPFGVSTPVVFNWQRRTYPDTYTELYASFVARGTVLATSDGLVGAITSRAFLTISRLLRFRIDRLMNKMELLLDLGPGVMDAALVEACAYVVGPGARVKYVRAIDATGLENRSDVQRCLTGQRVRGAKLFTCNWDQIAMLPSAKILYGLGHRFFDLLADERQFEPTIGTVRQGMGTFADFRFVRLRWEVPPNSIGIHRTWEPLAKGGPYALYYGDIHLVLNWKDDGAELCEVNIQHNGQTAQVRQASDWWRKGGCTYSKRSAKGFSARALPSNCIITGKGPAILSLSAVSNQFLLGWLNSRLIRGLIELQANAYEFNTGILKKLPWRKPALADEIEMTRIGWRCAELARSLRGYDEADAYFAASSVPHSLPAGYEVASQSRSDATAAILAMSSKADEIVDALYDVDSRGLDAFDEANDEEGTDTAEDEDVAQAGGSGLTIETFAAFWVSYGFGCSMGHWDANSPRSAEAGRPDIPTPFDPLPACSPGMLTGDDGLPLASPPPGYPIAFPIDGILVDDPGHDRDLLARIHQVFTVLFASDADDRLAEAVSILDPSAQSLRPWLRRTFFEEHIQRYSKSRRKAPIYWRLGTPSGSYSVWIYLHRFNKDTLHRVLNDHVAPKLRYESGKLAALQSEGGPSPSPSQRRALADQETFVDELRALQDELDRVAPLWDPDLDDGVVINASFLHRLFAHTRAWQRECESHWQKLQKGEYDWAHLAMRLWPERVVPKCTEDRSLAIAHGLEDALWLEGTDGKWRPQPVTDEQIAALVQERTSTAVKDALRRMGETPEPVAARKVRAAAPAGEPKPPKKAKVAKVPEGVQLGLGLGSDPTATELNAVRAALHAADDGLPKAELLAACGLDEDAGAAALAALVQTGEVVKIGAGRGTRYRLGGEG